VTGLQGIYARVEVSTDFRVFQSKGTSFRPEPCPLTSTDHVLPDKGIGPFSDSVPVRTGDLTFKGVVLFIYSL
jgi:hypothetical protein